MNPPVIFGVSVEQLIRLVAEERIAELSINGPDEYLRILRRSPEVAGGPCGAPREESAPAQAGDQPSLKDSSLPSSGESVEEATLKQFCAPMPGVFYRSASNAGAALIDVGATVVAGTPLCIIEAMKIMNEVCADREGIVEKVLCENGQSVDAGEPLFVLR